MKTAAGQALECLHACRDALAEARLHALGAQAYLGGARATRAAELAERIADAITYAERLKFVVEGDARYDAAAQAGGAR
ncbi:hypothetical protein MSM1_17590 [Mycobacterium sp. SM1]|uniref:hypothetical protein n=1 Tax=Mycobacterium sp. SM1 TaxID=2816243 RepID=UPI001BCC74E3|nr:hypothetical protein [Mycobacterium sp. SM1]MBS4730072.1 hypothetical protein [Mycobacterium sp. SM1]